MKFDYFYNRDGDKWSFIMLPKLLMTEDEFKGLSSDAKILYSCLLERTSLSSKNKWIDKENRVYIIFTIEEIMETFHKSNKTAAKILSELEKIGLIEKKRQGLGKPNIIYVKDFMTVIKAECKNYSSEVKNLHSRDVDITLQEVKNLHGINTNYNKTDNTNTNYSILEQKKSFGTFQNVFLSEDEFKDLEKKLNYKLENYIERLSSYQKSTGKKYKDHKATILTWYHKDNANKKQKSNVYSLNDYEKGEHL